MKKFLFITVFFLSLASLQAQTQKFQKGEVPKNIVIVSQSSEMSETFITGIDLDNNELVIIRIDYDGQYWCYRTGITCAPENQSFVQGNSNHNKPKN